MWSLRFEKCISDFRPCFSIKLYNFEQEFVVFFPTMFL